MKKKLVSVQLNKSFYSFCCYNCDMSQVQGTAFSRIPVLGEQKRVELVCCILWTFRLVLFPFVLSFIVGRKDGDATLNQDDMLPQSVGCHESGNPSFCRQISKISDDLFWSKVLPDATGCHSLIMKRGFSFPFSRTCALSLIRCGAPFMTGTHTINPPAKVDGSVTCDAGTGT